jgi:PhnB protein
MTTINSYISFNGRCEEAFTFYKSIFGGEFSYLGRFKDMPSEQELSETDKERIMHVSLPISDETVLMGDDSLECTGKTVTAGNNVHLSVNASSEDEAHRIFRSLAEGGTITMPIEKTFWGALFGMLIDQFGIQWMVNYDYKKED